MTSVSVSRAGGLDARRGGFELAADFLHDVVEAADPYAEWVVVRPDTLKDGDVTEYATTLTSSAPGCRSPWRSC